MKPTRLLTLLLSAILVAVPVGCAIAWYWLGQGDLLRFASQLWLTRIWVLALLGFLALRFFTQPEPLQLAKNFFFQSSSPFNLAVLRIIHFSVFVFALVFTDIDMDKAWTGGYQYFPQDTRVPIPWAGYADYLPVSPQIVDALMPVFKIAAVFSFLGLFTRISTKVYVLILFYFLTIQQMFGKVNHGHYMLWFAAILAFSDCGRVLSLDWLIRKYVRKKETDTTPAPEYGLPLKVGMLLLGLIYFFPGFWKLWAGGFDWILSLNLRALMYTKWEEMGNWLPAFRIDQHPVLMFLSSAFVVAFELAFIFLLFKARNRLFLFIAGILMHIAIYVFMNINFFMLLLNYPVLLDWGVLFKQPSKAMNVNAEQANTALRRSSLLLLFMLPLFFMNVLTGIFKVNSWPWSCFPTFENVLPEKLNKVRYEGYAAGIVKEDHAAIRKRILKTLPDFNLGNIEYAVMNGWYNEDENKMNTYLNTAFAVKENFEGLDSVRVYVTKCGISPEDREKCEDKIFITTVLLR